MANKAAAQLNETEVSLRTQRIEANRERQISEISRDQGAITATNFDSLLHCGTFLGLPIPGLQSFIPDALEDSGLQLPQDEPNLMDENAKKFDELKGQEKQTRHQLPRSARGRTTCWRRSPAGRAD